MIDRSRFPGHASESLRIRIRERIEKSSRQSDTSERDSAWKWIGNMG